MQHIWWEHLGSSLALLHRITNQIAQQSSLLLHLEDPLPWRDQFDTNLLNATARHRHSYQFHLEDGSGIHDPAAFLLEHYSPASFNCMYWPDSSAAEFVCSDSTIPLHESMIYVRGINDRLDLIKWTSFVQEYQRVSAELPIRALFLLEYCGPSLPYTTLPVLSFRVEPYHCSLFCMNAVQDVDDTAWRKRLAADIACNAAPKDPELCAALLQDTEALLCSPVNHALSVLRRFSHADGTPLTAPPDRAALESAVWQAQISLCFSKVEQRRLTMIRRHTDALKQLDNVRNPDGSLVTDPLDLEINAMYYLAGQRGGIFSHEEVQELTFLREVRNKLAHLDLLTPDELGQLFGT